jgi:hypothetical protein
MGGENSWHLGRKKVGVRCRRGRPDARVRRNRKAFETTASETNVTRVATAAGQWRIGRLDDIRRQDCLRTNAVRMAPGSRSLLRMTRSSHLAPPTPDVSGNAILGKLNWR